MKEYKGYYGKEKGTATFSPAVATDVAINERNENLRKLFATKRKTSIKSISYNNLQHVTDVDGAQKGQTGSHRNWHIANEARSNQTVANYGSTTMATPIKKTGTRLRRWSVNRCGNMDIDKNVQHTSLASNRSQLNIRNDDCNANNNIVDVNVDDDDDIVCPVGEDIDKTAVEDDIDIDLCETRNQQYCSSYELATLRFDNVRLSKNKLLENEHCLPIIKPYMKQSNDDFDVGEENFDAPLGFVGNCHDAVETCSPNDFFLSSGEEDSYDDQWSMVHGKSCENFNTNRSQQQQDRNDFVNVNSMSELMKIRLERQAENPLRQKYQQAQKEQQFWHRAGSHGQTVPRLTLKRNSNVSCEQKNYVRHRTGSHERIVPRVTEKRISNVSSELKNDVPGHCKNHAVGTEQLWSNINLSTQLHSADIWRNTDENKGNLYTADNCRLYADSDCVDYGMAKELDNLR